MIVTKSDTKQNTWVLISWPYKFYPQITSTAFGPILFFKHFLSKKYNQRKAGFEFARWFAALGIIAYPWFCSKEEGSLEFEVIDTSNHSSLMKISAIISELHHVKVIKQSTEKCGYAYKHLIRQPSPTNIVRNLEWKTFWVVALQACWIHYFLNPN